MTVSPQGSQDGDHPPSIGVNGVESGASLGSPALPPTLFKLPNLNSVDRGQVQLDQSPADDPMAERQTPADQLTSRPIAPAPLHSSDQPHTPEPPAVSTTAPAVPAGTADTSNAHSAKVSHSSERYLTPHHQPAGRSWMERIGSHSAVVVLLLIVIAAGLVIGRNSADQGFDSSLADNSDLLDFDEGTELDLPLPKHGYQPQASVADVEPSKVVSARTSEPKIADIEPGTATSNAMVANEVEAGTSEVTVASEETNAAVEETADSAALLNNPQTDLASAGAVDADRMEVNKVNDGSTNVDFMAASSRVPVETSDDDLPTLDELDDQSEGESELSLPEVTTPAHRLSKTPAPIIDWRLYLPREQRATTDTDVPLTSN